MWIQSFAPVPQVHPHSAWQYCSPLVWIQHTFGVSVGPEQTSILATFALLDTRCSCSVGSLPDSVTAGACGDSMFKHSNYETVFQRGCTILYSCQQSTVVLVSFSAFDPRCEVARGQLWFADPCEPLRSEVQHLIYFSCIQLHQGHI